MRRVLACLIPLALVGATLFLWGWPNRPVSVGGHGWPLQSVSFAPFRADQSPLTQSYPSAGEIDQDMARLAGRVGALRTYTSLEGMEAVPRLAARHGLKVTHGAWLSPRRAANEREIAALIAAANGWPDSVERVIVGNEVLLRGELTAAEIAGYLRRVRQAVRQPVSYADVWEYWMQNPELAAEVDFITAHILPYWEDEPVGVEQVGAHISAVHRMLQTRFPGKPILIGETGWPSAGRSREAAVPGRVNQARFLQTFLDLAQREGLDYNVIEAFDQPWKSAQEGTVGANWGLFGSDRALKFEPGEPLAENPAWPVHGGAAVLLGLLPLAWFLRRRPEPAAVAGYTALALLMASLMVLAAVPAFSHAYSAPATAFAAGRLLLQAGLALALLAAAARMLAPAPAAPGRERLGEMLARDGSLAAAGHGLYMLLAGLAAGMALALVVDPRYRDFPIPDLLVPVFGLLGFKALEALWRRRPSLALGRLLRTEGDQPPGPASGRHMSVLCLMLGAALPALGFAVILREGLANHEALAFAAMLSFLALPFLIELARRRRRR